MSHHEPTILDRLQVGGLHPDLVAEFRDRHRRRTPCHCSVCSKAPPAPLTELTEDEQIPVLWGGGTE